MAASAPRRVQRRDGGRDAVGRRIGALLSPPTLGAAAFLIAEFLRISYLQILVMATIPTLLYYFDPADDRGRRAKTRPR